MTSRLQTMVVVVAAVVATGWLAGLGGGEPMALFDALAVGLHSRARAGLALDLAAALLVAGSGCVLAREAARWNVGAEAQVTAGFFAVATLASMMEGCSPTAVVAAGLAVAAAEWTLKMYGERAGRTDEQLAAAQGLADGRGRPAIDGVGASPSAEILRAGHHVRAFGAGEIVRAAYGVEAVAGVEHPERVAGGARDDVHQAAQFAVDGQHLLPQPGLHPAVAEAVEGILRADDVLGSGNDKLVADLDHGPDVQRDVAFPVVRLGGAGGGVAELEGVADASGDEGQAPVLLAIVAVARRLLCVMVSMLQGGRSYRAAMV